MASIPTSFQQPRNINTMELTLPVRPSITNTHLTKLNSFRSTQPSVRRKILQYCIGHNERKPKFSMVLPPQLDNNNQVMRYVRKKIPGGLCETEKLPKKYPALTNKRRYNAMMLIFGAIFPAASILLLVRWCFLPSGLSVVWRSGQASFRVLGLSR